MLGPVFERFVQKAPAAVMVRGILERILGEEALNGLFAGVFRHPPFGHRRNPARRWRRGIERQICTIPADSGSQTVFRPRASGAPRFSGASRSFEGGGGRGASSEIAADRQ
jgi:hypothetical protein